MSRRKEATQPLGSNGRSQPEIPTGEPPAIDGNLSHYEVAWGDSLQSESRRNLQIDP